MNDREVLSNLFTNCAFMHAMCERVKYVQTCRPGIMQSRRPNLYLARPYRVSNIVSCIYTCLYVATG